MPDHVTLLTGIKHAGFGTGAGLFTTLGTYFINPERTTAMSRLIRVRIKRDCSFRRLRRRINRDAN